MNQTPSPRPHADDPLRIVLIDDNPDDCDHIRRTLLAGLNRRFELFEATSGEEGVKLCSEVTAIGCVVLDMHLPDMTGLDVLSAIREEHGDIVWPVVVLTGSMGDGEPASVLRAGAQDFIAKEWITPESLARALDNATERHKLHQDLRHAEERLRLALAAADMGTWEWDLTTNRVIWSQGHFSILGYTDTGFEPTYAHWRARVHPEDLADVDEALKKSRERVAEYRHAYRVIWSDGSVHWIEARGRYLLGAGRAVERMHGIMIDVTESKLATEALAQLNAELETRIAERTAQLVQAQKLDMVGQITGALAHDFNNLLYAILGNLEVLQHRSAGDAVALKLIDGALQGARRGSDLTKRLMSFVRREELRSLPVDVRSLLHGMDDLLRRSVGPMIEVRVAAAPDLWQATVDPSQFELALLNLAVNARDAMPAGGTITVKMENETLSGGAAYPAELRAGDYVRVTVADRGVGMDAATLQRATEPFFTTKGDGKGTGLGLASVHGLALQSGGALRLTSRTGEGTTIEMWLPKAPADAWTQPPADPAATSGEAAPGPLKVLLVDDDALIAMSTKVVLEDLGHAVQIAGSGKKALDVLLADAGIELVISDQAMPGMSGLELVDRIRERWPRLPILLATGYDDGNGDDRNLPRIIKPYSQQELTNAICSVMNAAGDRAFITEATDPQ